MNEYENYTQDKLPKRFLEFLQNISAAPLELTDSAVYDCLNWGPYIIDCFIQDITQNQAGALMKLKPGDTVYCVYTFASRANPDRIIYSPATVERIENGEVFVRTDNLMAFPLPLSINPNEPDKMWLAVNKPTK